MLATGAWGPEVESPFLCRNLGITTFVPITPVIRSVGKIIGVCQLSASFQVTKRPCLKEARWWAPKILFWHLCACMPIPTHKHGCIYTPHTQYTHVQQIHPCILTDKYSDSLLYTKWSISRVEDILSWCKNKMRLRWAVCLVQLQLLFCMWMSPNLTGGRAMSANPGATITANVMDIHCSCSHLPPVLEWLTAKKAVVKNKFMRTLPKLLNSQLSYHRKWLFFLL